jgi:hypothetical protein
VYLSTVTGRELPELEALQPLLESGDLAEEGLARQPAAGV